MLKLEKISYKADDRLLVENISLQAKAGKTTVLLGPSGSGKSTLLKVIAGIAKQESGRILYHKKDISNLKTAARSIGYVSQNPSLLPFLKIWQNIALAIRANKKTQEAKARKLLLENDLLEYADAYPQQLSIGQQQQISIIRAIAAEAKILLFDEPYANLDLKNKDKLLNQTIELCKKNSAIKILVTHNPYEAMIAADYIYVMNQGLIMSQGTTKELYDYPDNEFIAKLFGLANILEQDQARKIIGKNAQNTGKDCAISEDIKYVIRPHNIVISAATQSSKHKAIIENKKFYYGKNLYYLTSLNKQLKLQVISNEDFNVGDECAYKILSYSCY